MKKSNIFKTFLLGLFILVGFNASAQHNYKNEDMQDINRTIKLATDSSAVVLNNIAISADNSYYANQEISSNTQDIAIHSYPNDIYDSGAIAPSAIASTFTAWEDANKFNFITQVLIIQVSNTPTFRLIILFYNISI